MGFGEDVLDKDGVRRPAEAFEEFDRWRESSWCDFLVWLSARVGMEGGGALCSREACGAFGGPSFCWSK